MRDRVKSLTDENEDTYTCENEQFWPPPEAFIYENAQAVRAEWGDTVYERFRVWERVCGLKSMSHDKCLECPHVLKNGQNKRRRKSALPSAQAVGPARNRKR